jgi:hypothetical protein
MILPRILVTRQQHIGYLVFSAFTSRPTSLLASIKVSVFSFMVSMLSPSLCHQHRQAADVSHLISVQPGYPRPS